jgi:DNA-binding transcriptional MocR family regulator
VARFDGGYIKLYRACVNGDIGWSGVQLAVWVTLLAWATRFETSIRWQGRRRVIPPGTVVTAIRDLADHLCFSKDAVARALAALNERDSIRVESATRGTLVTICNWSEYYDLPAECATPPRHERDTDETLAGRQPDLIGELENKKTKTRRKGYPPEFEEIYRAYPRHEGKSGGFKVYEKQILSPADHAELSKAIANYKSRKAGTELRYLLMFSSFMHQWHDWLDADAGRAAAPQTPQLKTREDLKREGAA